MPDDLGQQPQPQTGPGAWFKRNSTTITIVAIGIVAGIAFLKKPQNSASQTASTGDFSGLAVDDQGRPIIYRDVSDTFINEYINSNNTTLPNPTQPVATAPVTINVNPASPVEHPIENTAYVRSRYSIPSVKTYDEKVASGVPLRDTPGGREIGQIPYGVQIKVLEGPTSGGSNLPGTTAGSAIWFKVTGGGKTGWVSKFDLDVARAG